MSKLRLPTAAEISTLTRDERAELLAMCAEGLPDENGFVPKPAFLAIASIATLPTVEVAPFRTVRTGDEILLTRRPPVDDPWPDQWHVPGAAIRPTDAVNGAGYTKLFARIFGKELKGGVRPISTPRYFDSHPRTGVRGPEHTTFFLADVVVVDPTADLPVGQFFNVRDVLQNPPDGGLVEQHAETIERAAHSYRAARS